MSTAQNIISPIDYKDCKNADRHGPLLERIVTNLNDASARAGKAEAKAGQTDEKFEVFKAKIDGKFELINERIDTIDKKAESAQTAASGIATTNDLTEQNKILVDAMMKIFTEKGTSKRSWITFAGIILVALIGLIPLISNILEKEKNDKTEIILQKIEALEAKQ